MPSHNLFQDGPDWDDMQLTAENAKLDGGGSSIQAIIPGTHTTVDKGLISYPLFFVRTGQLNKDTALVWASATSNYWSATKTSLQTTVFLIFNTVALQPSNNTATNLAYSLRCLHSQ